jgi:hypothetical protein
MAGKGKKTFVAGEILIAQDVNEYLMDQSVMNFASSAARSSAIPTPTEGMVTYLSDIKNLELYDGSSFVSVGGLAHIKTTEFTSQTAVNFNNVFTSSFTNYRIVLNASLSTNVFLQFRFRNAGADITTNNYFSHFALSNSLSTAYGTAGTSSAGSAFVINGTDIATPISASFDVFNAAATKAKRMNGIASYGTASAQQGGQSFLGVNLTTAFDGFSFFMASGNFTGDISVYGYRK